MKQKNIISLSGVNHNNIKLGENIMINENKEQDKQVTTEYGTENLNNILSDYLRQKFVEILEKEQNNKKVE